MHDFDAALLCLDTWALISLGIALISLPYLSLHLQGASAHGFTLAQDYCGVAESTGLGRDCFSQKRALSLINANLRAVCAMLAPSAERAKGEGSSRRLRSGLSTGGWFLPKRADYHIRVGRSPSTKRTGQAGQGAFSNDIRTKRARAPPPAEKCNH